MPLFKSYDIVRVLESVENLIDAYFRLLRKTHDHGEALDALVEGVYPSSDVANDNVRKRIISFVQSLAFYPESEQMKFVVKSLVLNLHRGIKKNTKDDHEINRKLYLTYKSLKTKHRIKVDSFDIEDFDRLGFWEGSLPR